MDELARGRDAGRALADLPTRSPILSFAEDPVNPRLLFAGGEFGIHATLDAGAHWFSLQLNLPTTAVHDMVIHPRAHDLVIGSHGRGIWILDSIAGLRALTPDAVAAPAALFQPRPAMLLTRFDRGRTSLGSAYYTAANPPDGALIDFYVKPGAADSAAIEIFDATGRRLRRIEVSRPSGLTRVVWDLRGDPPPDAAPAQGRGRGGAARPLVTPGTYEARLSIGSQSYRTRITVQPDPGR